MPIVQTQVALSNTFNEFRLAHNDVANTVAEIAGGSTTLTVGKLIATNVESTFGNTTHTYVSSLTPGRVTVAATGGKLVDDAGLLFDTATNQLTVDGALIANGNVTINTNKFTVNATSGNASVGGALAVSGTTTLTGSTTFGNGANSAIYHASNGSLILTSNLDGVEIGKVQANHLHADWHVGAGGNLETWATAKGDNADTHHVFAVANTNAPIDMMVVNQNEGNEAYAEFIAIHATGNTTDGWASVGVNSTNYADAAYGITKADDAYLLYSAPVGTVHSGDLVIGTSGNGTGNKIIFSAEGFDDPANNTQMVITPGQNIHIEIDTQSSNTTTGALTVNGGIGLVGNLNIGGNVAITGTITLGGTGNTVSTSSLSVANSLVFLAANNAADALDLGFIGEYTSSGRKYTGLVRDASDGVYKLFANNSTIPANTVNFGTAGVTFADLVMGVANVRSTTASSTTTTGALLVAGGAGIAGQVTAGGALKTTDSTASTSTTTGSIIAGGGLGVAGQLTAATIEVTKSQEVFQTLTHSGSGALTVNFTSGNVVYLNQAANITSFTLQNIPASKAFSFTILRKNTAGSAVTITWGSTFKWPDGGTAPTLTATLNSIDMFTFVTFDGGTTIYAVKSGTNFA